MTNQRFNRVAQRAMAALTCGFLVATSIAWAQEDATKDNENPPNEAKAVHDPAEQVREDVQERAGEARDRGKAAAKNVRDNAKKKADDARDKAESLTDEASERADRAREEVEERAGDAPERGKEVSKKTRDRAEEIGDRARESADDPRGRARKTVDNARDRVREFAGGDRGQFEWDNVRSADIGIWFDRSSKDALLISDVSSKGAIAKVGFQEGDRIVSINGHKVTRDTEFMKHLFADDVQNDKLEVIVLRDGSNTTVYVEPKVLKDGYYVEEHDPLHHFGVVLDDRYDDRVVVWKVVPRSPAFYAGIRDGDVITKFRGDTVAAIADFVQAVRGIEPGTVDVSVERQKRAREYQVDIPRFAERTDRREANREERGERREDRREDTRRDQREDERDERRDGREARDGR